MMHPRNLFAGVPGPSNVPPCQNLVHPQGYLPIYQQQFIPFQNSPTSQIVSYERVVFIPVTQQPVAYRSSEANIPRRLYQNRGNHRAGFVPQHFGANPQHNHNNGHNNRSPFTVRHNVPQGQNRVHRGFPRRGNYNPPSTRNNYHNIRPQPQLNVTCPRPFGNEWRLSNPSPGYTSNNCRTRGENRLQRRRLQNSNNVNDNQPILAYPSPRPTAGNIAPAANAFRNSYQRPRNNANEFVFENTFTYPTPSPTVEILPNISLSEGSSVNLLDSLPQNDTLQLDNGHMLSSSEQFGDEPISDFTSVSPDAFRNLNSFRSRSRFIDVIFVVQDREFPAHKVLLTSRSSFFREVLVDNGELQLIQINDIRVDCFEALLDYIYTGEVEQLDSLVKHLMHAAAKYDIDSLYDFCFDYNSNPIPRPKDRILFEADVFSGLQESFKSLHLFSDVTLVVGGREYPAHKVVLSARSSLFDAMFACDEVSDQINSRIKIGDVTVECFEAMLNFIYTDEIRDVDFIGPELLAAAREYDIKPLVYRCLHC